jgi:N-acetylglucosaminyl-diphospho-decaprenol L-rhamnosyltransferase
MSVVPTPTPAGGGRAGTVRLGVVVVNFGSSHLLAENLADLTGGAGPGESSGSSPMIVVVDNWSSSAERRSVTALARRHGWELIAADTNLGFGPGMNRGVAHAFGGGCTHVLLLNPDVGIDPGTVTRLLAFVLDHPGTLVSPRIDRPDGSPWFLHGRIDRRTGLTRSIRPGAEEGPDRWLSGACLVADRATWELVGGFDERYFLYWEDIDLSQRLLERGGELTVVHDVSVTHSVHGTQRRRGRSARYCFHMCRNRLRFAAFRLPPADRLRWVWYAPAYMRRAVLGGWRSAVRHPWPTVHALAGTAAGACAVLGSVVGRRRPPRDG